MKQFIIYSITFSLFVLAGSLSSQAQLSDPAVPKGAGPQTSITPESATAVSNLNRDTILNFIHQVNSGEITLANEALQRLETPQARDFAQMMIHDHQEGEEQVAKVANQMGLPLYDFQASTLDIAIQAQLSALSGITYDLTYLHTQLTAHQTALQDLTLLQSQSTDPQIQNLINQTLPVIQKHIQMAKSSLKEIS